MLIGELAEATGVSRRSLRYYEQVGLICADRTAGGWRRFPPETVQRVIAVQHLFAAGLRSGTIARILPCLEAAPDERTGEMEQQLAAEIDRRNGSVIWTGSSACCGSYGGMSRAAIPRLGCCREFV